MRMNRRAALGGIQLDEQDASIIIRGIDTGVPHESMEAVNRLGGVGQRVTMQHWEYLDVNITFAIDKKKTELAARRTAFDKALKWAMRKGWLTVNYMSGRRLYIDKAILPSAGDLWDWTSGYTITLRAYGVPFWQDETATTSTGSSITVPGVMETVCNANIVNSGSSTINDLTVIVGSSQFVFENLGLGAGETLEIGHTNDGLVTIQIKSAGDVYRSAYGKRATISADDLVVEPGENGITVAGGTTTKTISCCGRWT